CIHTPIHSLNPSSTPSTTLIFPTLLSSDLRSQANVRGSLRHLQRPSDTPISQAPKSDTLRESAGLRLRLPLIASLAGLRPRMQRSEEHTSGLQSLTTLLCHILLLQYNSLNY